MEEFNFNKISIYFRFSKYLLTEFSNEMTESELSFYKKLLTTTIQSGQKYTLSRPYEAFKTKLFNLPKIK